MPAIAVSDNTNNIEGGGSMDLREKCQKAIDTGISIRSLARKIDYDNSTLSKWLRGERNISDEVKDKLTLVLQDLKEQWNHIEI